MPSAFGNGVFLGVAVWAVLPKANRMGAILAMLGGVVSYCVCMAMQIKVFDLHQIVIGIGVSLILFLIGTCIGKAQDEEVLRVFFPERYPD